MKCKAGKKPEGESKEVGNERGLVSMFQKQQAVNDLNKERETYDTQLQNEKGKEVGFRVRRGRAGRDGSP